MVVGAASTAASMESSTTPSSSSTFDSNWNQRLCSVQLNDFNYLPWSRAVTLALGGRSRIDFIDGSNVAPNNTSTHYKAWFANDQMVQSWLLNTMEPHIAEIFSYSDSAADLWRAVKEFYGNHNNAARVFQLKKNIASLPQEGKPFVQFLGSMKALWNELAVYRPHTTDPVILLKRAEEDKIFQLLANMDPDYEDLCSRILMNSELPTFASVCATIQREETRKKVMSVPTKTDLSDTRAYLSTQQYSDNKWNKSRRNELKCSHCSNIGHTIDRCWTLHPELKPKFANKGGPKRGPTPAPGYQANLVSASSSDGLSRFTSSPINLINEFATYMQAKQDAADQNKNHAANTSSALLGNFAGFLAGSKNLSSTDASGSNDQEDDW